MKLRHQSWYDRVMEHMFTTADQILNNLSDRCGALHISRADADNPLVKGMVAAGWITVSNSVTSLKLDITDLGRREIEAFNEDVRRRSR